MNTQPNSNAGSGCPDTNCSALAILQGCGLHRGYYGTIEKAAEGVRDIIRSLRADHHDPPHDIQCAVLRKLGVEGFTKEGVAPTHKLIPLPNAIAVAPPTQDSLEALRDAVRNLRDVQGRHHTQIATERLFALLPENETSPSVDATEMKP